MKWEVGLGVKGVKCNFGHTESEKPVGCSKGEVHLQTWFCALESLNDRSRRHLYTIFI